MSRLPSVAFFLALPLLAIADQSRGGFEGPGGPALVTAAEAAALPDDTEVIVEGYITRTLGDEKYEFRDDSGTLVVEIDDDEWGGVEATPEVRVRIVGETDDDDEQLDAETVQLAE